MENLTFLPLPSEHVQALRDGGSDAYGQPAERVRCTSAGNPCRHCLGFIPEGADMLILAYRPFESLQPYAETGPIFLCADDCLPWSGAGVPPILQASPDYLLKGYTHDQRIRYGTGQVVVKQDIARYAAELLERDEIHFVDVRSARNNCFQVRIMRNA